VINDNLVVIDHNMLVFEFNDEDDYQLVRDTFDSLGKDELNINKFFIITEKVLSNYEKKKRN